MYIETSNDPQKRKNQGSYNNGSKMKQNGHLFTERKAIAITRVSTQNQCDSLEVQINTINEYLKNHPELSLINIHNLKESAYCLKQQDLDDIIKNAPNGCAIIIMKVDRLTRNHKDIPVFEEKMEQHDIEFHFIEEGLIWNKYSDRSVSNDVANRTLEAEKESIKTSQRTKACNAIMRSKGKITYPAPFGYINYQLGREKGWKPEETESKYVKDLFSMYSTGQYSIECLVHILNKKYEKQIEKPVSTQTASELLKNRFFIGWAKYDNNLYKHNYETFISEELFEACQKILKQKQPKNLAPKELISPLYHMVKHKQSGYSFTPYKKKNGIYMKTNKSVKDNLPNEKQIIEGIHNALKPLSNHEEIKNMLHTRINEANIKQVEAVSTKIAHTQQEINTYNDRATKLLSGEIYGASEVQIERALSDLNFRIQNQTENLNTYKAQKQALLHDQIIIYDDLVETFDGMSIENKHNMLETLFSGIIYDDGVLTYNFWPHINKSAVSYRPAM